MSETQTEKETETVAGVIGGITLKKEGTWTVSVTPDGSQYSKNLWTQDSELVAALAQKIGNQAAFECNVSHWTNQDGKPVRSLWISGEQQVPDRILGVDLKTPTAGGNVRPTQQPAQWTENKPVDWDAKERRDYRSRAWAQTLGAFTHTIKVDEDPVQVFQRLQPFQRKIFTDVCQSFAFPDDDSDVPFG